MEHAPVWKECLNKLHVTLFTWFEIFVRQVLRWPNTVFALIERSFYLFKTCTFCAIFSIIKRSVLMPLFCYYKDMLGKVRTQTTQKFLAFLCYRKNPVKYSACAVARKIEMDCFCRNLPISNDPVNRISRNLAEQ